MNHRMLSLGILAIVGLLTGCSTVPVEEDPALPFSAALIPVEVDDGWRPTVQGAQELEIELSLAAQKVTDRLTEQLRNRCFTRVVSLAAPEGPGGAGLEPNTEQWYEHWENEAKKQGVDLLLECRMQYTPKIYSRGSALYWPNFAIHQVGGPFCFWINDRSYQSPAEFEISIHDVQSIRSDRGHLIDKRAEILNVYTEYSGTDLSFYDRSAHWGNYLLAILVPTGLMATENDKIRTRLEDEVVETLVTSIADKIREGARRLLRGDQVSDFYIEPEGFRVARQPDGKLSIQGEVICVQKKGQRAKTPDRYQLSVARRSFPFGEGIFDEARSGTAIQYYRYPVNQVLETDPDLETVQMTVWDTTESPRSFTFSIENAR